MKIPKIIHQIYEDVDGKGIPSRYIELSETWKKMNTTWEYYLWDKESILNLLKNDFDHYITVYNSFPYNMQRWDAVRYLIMYKYGGLYVDFDYECLESIEPLLNEQTCCFGMEPTVHAEQQGRKENIGTAFMASVPMHDFIKKIKDTMFSYEPPTTIENKLWHIWETTGPHIITKLYHEYEQKESIFLIPEEKIAPLCNHEISLLKEGFYTKSMEEKIENAYAIHYFDGSWVDV